MIQGIRPEVGTDGTEAGFYASYEWCLNPILSVRDLVRRLGEETARTRSVSVAWQRDEVRLNVYLLAAALTGTIDDYLAWQPWNLSALARLDLPFASLIPLAGGILNTPHRLRRAVFDRSTRDWRRQWNRPLDQVCDMLAGEVEPSPEQWAVVRHEVASLARVGMPERLLVTRMRLPEAFRCQDLTHHDVLALADRYRDAQGVRPADVAVIGLRTAGSYFAPLVRARLSAYGWPQVSWTTIRPKAGLTRAEGEHLSALARRDARIVLVDDHPNTGGTWRLTLEILRRYGVQPDRTTILVPRHPARAGWTLPRAPWSDGVTVITLDPAELYKARWLESDAITRVLAGCDPARRDVVVRQTDDTDRINMRLSEHFGDGFQVRLKRVFEVEDRTDPERPRTDRVLAKSVGWGWLGYHGYIIGDRLAGSVPPLIGLRDGFTVSQWVDRVPAEGVPDPAGRARAMAIYVARRVNRLRLPNDPFLDGRLLRWVGWDELISILRDVYGMGLGRAKKAEIRRQLTRYVSPCPAVIDGNMAPDDWIETGTGLCKVDYEHHAFGAPTQLDVVDCAFDLAAAVFESSLSDVEEAALIDAYARQSGDTGVAHRMLLYHIFYGVLAARYAWAALDGERSEERRRALNARHLRALYSLIRRMDRFHAGLAGHPEPPRWSGPLVFLDLDGVFYRDLMGFAQPTFKGVAALERLRSAGFTVLVNTARSVVHVREFCRTYGLAGGLAEDGAVFVDAVERQERPLLDADAARQLARCREILETASGVLLDPENAWSIRAYRCVDGASVGLGADADELVARPDFDRLAVVHRSTDTYIIQRGVNKGSGLVAVKRHLGRVSASAVAIGHSTEDLEALRLAEISYSPANCSADVRALARSGGCRLVRQSYQRGLLAMAVDLIERHVDPTRQVRPPARPAADSTDLIASLVRAADRPRALQFLAALDWRRL
jgi:hydroxymethylpyrimidine pyrophosphatase-like HAD family hydrolase